MYRIFSSLFKFSALGFFILFIPQNIYAAQLNFKIVPNNVPTDRATIVEVRVDPQSKNVNVVEGKINFQGSVSDNLSVDVETGGSLLTIWPISPQYDSSGKTISFTGGTPGGFNNEGLLFRIRLAALSTGDINILWTEGKAYLNDGNGTEENISAKNISVNLDQKNSNNISKTSPDKTSPNFDSVLVGQDPNTYDGKYFISFNATDDISGVEKYEIKEGESVTNVTDGVYILKDQDRKTKITITAYDKAGNKKIVTVQPRFNWIKNVTIILISVIVLFIVLLYGFKKFKK